MEPSAATPPTFGRTGIVSPPDSDPDLAPVALDGDLAAPKARTMLDELRAELAAEVEVEDFRLDVPERPGYAVVYAADVTYDELTAWRKRAKDTSKPGGINELRLSTIILANKAVDLIRQGEPTGLTFRDPALVELLGAGSATDAVRRLYGLDGHVNAAALAVLQASGFGDELAEAGDDADPTRGR